MYWSDITARLRRALRGPPRVKQTRGGGSNALIPRQSRQAARTAAIGFTF
ncbi:hypothetical protein ACVIKP_001243 [Rhizobium leguminosarum]